MTKLLNYGQIHVDTAQHAKMDLVIYEYIDGSIPYMVKDAKELLHPVHGMYYANSTIW
jgi:hypothetical protein